MGACRECPGDGQGSPPGLPGLVGQRKREEYRDRALDCILQDARQKLSFSTSDASSCLPLIATAQPQSRATMLV